jgi:hypothetical protein
MTLRRGKVGLTGRRANPAERSGYWQPHVTRKVRRLIEAPLAPARRVERDRHRDVGACQNLSAPQAHQ